MGCGAVVLKLGGLNGAGYPVVPAGGDIAGVVRIKGTETLLGAWGAIVALSSSVGERGTDELMGDRVDVVLLGAELAG